MLIEIKTIYKMHVTYIEMDVGVWGISFHQNRTELLVFRVGTCMLHVSPIKYVHKYKDLVLYSAKNGIKLTI